MTALLGPCTHDLYPETRSMALTFYLLLPGSQSIFWTTTGTWFFLAHHNIHILAICPWGPATAHGVGILTELYVIYIERNASHRTTAQCFGLELFPNIPKIMSIGPLAAAGEVVTGGQTDGHTESQTIIMDILIPLLQRQ